MFRVLHEGDIFLTGDEFPFVSGSRLAQLPGGGLICTFNTATASGYNDFTPMVSYSEDGLTWSEARPIWPELQRSKSISLSVRSTYDGRICLAGIAWDIACPGELWWNDAQSAIKQNQLVFAISDDGKAFPAPTFLDLPFPGAAEEPGGMLVDADGTIHLVYSPYPVIDETSPSDTNSMVYLRSRDGGKTFDASRFAQVNGPCLYAETWIDRLASGALFVSTWQTAAEEATDQYCLSFDDGKRFTAPMPAPFRGQSTAVNARPDGTVLIAYNQRRENPVGVWLALAKPDAEGFHLLENQPVWLAQTATHTGAAEDFSGWTDFSFGEPHAITLDDGTVLLALWYAQDGRCGVRYVHLEHT